MPIANGIHHLAMSTKNMREQIRFFSEVCGMELVGLFYMHGAHGAFHCFLKLNDMSYMSFIQPPDMADKKGIKGVSYASSLIEGSAPGAFQHVAFNVGTQKELLALRDRIRRAGYQVIGTMDHGICRSIYLNAPENIIMEFVSAEDGDPLTPEMWVDPECAKQCGVTAEELQSFTNPPALELTDGTEPNPAEPKIPFEIMPPGAKEEMLALTDEQFGEKMDYTIAPNAEKSQEREPA